MSDIAIRVEKLGKRYRIGQRERYQALRDVLARTVTSPARRVSALMRSLSLDGRESHTGADSSSIVRRPSSDNYIWALKDVSFEIKEGEVVGIIGRNGAGKTTLLKILARITRPTEGYGEIHGRVGSLLEVGTGFHPELTGRENVYLSGAVLGMTRREIERKFDEIVEFAGVKDFIDTPLKYYSTGMQMRLAFAVAAHLEPEILLVDEVLAVGDLEFQKKCLGKMEEVSKGGRTVLFVSHQMNQIRRLCGRVMWLDAGRIRMSGPTHEVIGAYEAAMASGRWLREQERPDAPKAKARFLQWEIVEPREEQPNILRTLGPVTIRVIIRVDESVQQGRHRIVLFDSDGQLIWGWVKGGVSLPPGTFEFRYTFPYLPLRPGTYNWNVTLYDDRELVDTWYCVPEMIIATPNFQHTLDKWNGILNVPSEFVIEEMHTLPVAGAPAYEEGNRDEQ